MRQVPETMNKKMMKIHHFKQMKQHQQKISMLTCYDYPSAVILANSSVDCLLVGDSVAMAVHGYESTIMANMEIMALHTAAVARGLGHQFLVTDLPFMSYRISHEDTMQNAKKLLQAGAHAVKIEGADEDICRSIKKLVAAGVPVMGHIGLTPQSIHTLGGYKIQGKLESQQLELINHALLLEDAGCFAIVIECVPNAIAELITNKLSIPTIGIGAGNKTDGQILVWHDMLGLQTEFHPKFLKHFLQGKAILLDAINSYVEEVKLGYFPVVSES